MQLVILILMCVQVSIGLVELAVSLDKRFKNKTERVLHIPEEDREP